MSATAQDRTATRVLGLDRWRVRDAVACVRASAVEEIALDAAPQTPAPHAVVPVAAGLACGDHWRSRLADSTAEGAVRAYCRRTSLRVVYGVECAAIADTLTLTTSFGDQRLTTIVDGPRGRVATVEQTLADTPVAATGGAAVVDGASGSSLVTDSAEPLARIRVARWVYVSGELAAVHGDHVAAVGAGLPAAIVPASLLFAIVERALFPDEAPRGEVAVEFTQPVFAGERVVVLTDQDGEVRIQGTHGDAVKATSLGGVIAGSAGAGATDGRARMS